MADFRIGMLGCGGIANAHDRTLQDLAQVDLVALCDVAQERAADFNQQYAGGKATVYSDFRAMFEREKLNAVWICLPPFAHSNEIELASARRPNAHTHA